MNLEQLRELDATYHMQTYGRQPVAFVRGRGARLYDAEGNEYLDLLAGIAVMSVGHSHPRVVAAVQEQAAALTHVSNLFYTEPQARLAERLHGLLGWGKVFFANSGAEANECALKLARRWCARERGRPTAGVVATLGSFHGRTFTTLAATGQPHKHEAFLPLPAWFTHVPLNDEQSLESVIDDDTTAVILEVVQGEGGVVAATPEFLHAARKLCDERGAVLIFDEVQTGLGRTGRWFAFQHHDIAPDVVTIAKALGAGLPIGACIAREHIADAFVPGDHATTFGGGPVPCAAALAVLDVIESDGLVENAARMGAALRDGLRDATRGNPLVAEVRGEGLLIAIQLTADRAGEVVAAALGRRVIVNAVTPSAVRLAPPLVLTNRDVTDAVAELAAVLEGFGA